MHESANDGPATDTPLPKVVADDAAKLSACRKALRVAEVHYRRLFETAQDGILFLNAETARIEDVNPYLLAMLGYTHEEFVGKQLWEIDAFKGTALNPDAFSELQKTRYLRYDDFPLQTKDGREVDIEFVGKIYDCDGDDVVQCDISDITKRHLAESDLRATVRLLKMLSASNTALVNGKSKQALLAEYCRIAVETGSYRMAWIGFADTGPDKRVLPMVHFGHEDGYLALAEITWAEAEHGSCPTSRAIRTGQVQVVEDISTEPAMAPWRAEALKRGYQSSIALPFRYSQEIMACLTIYGTTPAAWAAPERELLQEIAADLAFGITTLRTANAKKQFEEDMRLSLEMTIRVIVGTIDQRDAYTSGHQQRVAHLSSHIAGELGLSAERIRGLHLAAMIHDLGKIGIPAEILAKPGRLSAMEHGLVRDHVNIGFKIIKDIPFPWPIAKIIQQHHERVDGSGYPHGLAGDAILLESKILAVADVVETMASHRPYRAALGIEAALDEIMAQSGIAFDSEVVEACLRLFRDRGYEIEA